MLPGNWQGNLRTKIDNYERETAERLNDDDEAMAGNDKKFFFDPDMVEDPTPELVNEAKEELSLSQQKYNWAIQTGQLEKAQGIHEVWILQYLYWTEKLKPDVAGSLKTFDPPKMN